MSGVWQIVLQNSFWTTEDKFSGLWRGDRIIVRGTTATSNELTGNFGSALEDTIGTNRTIRTGLMMSVDWGGPEVVGTGLNRRD